MRSSPQPRPHLLPSLSRGLSLLLQEVARLCGTSLEAQLVENPPAMWETQIRSLGWEDPLENGEATHSSVLAWRIPRTI